MTNPPSNAKRTGMEPIISKIGDMPFDLPEEERIPPAGPDGYIAPEARPAWRRTIARIARRRRAQRGR
ncbi:MAG: hypothetical protein JXB47_12760 [Anaerolineae bacterium]|nr:hypothetical protein [Anaerolineae bacterium]